MDFELYERLIPQLKSKSAREFYFTWACDIIALEPEDRVCEMNWDFMLDALQERIAEQ
jgi:hypothetical protein